MPFKLNKAYTNALRALSQSQKSRLDHILDADPRMAHRINEHGMEHLAKTPHPVTVMPPDKYLALAARLDPTTDETENVVSLLGRIHTRQPWTSAGLDFGDPDSLPMFMRDFAQQNPNATAFDMYRELGLGQPEGLDMLHGLDAHGVGSLRTIDAGGLPLLMWLQRDGKSVYGVGHEGRGRGAFMASQNSSLPVQLLERTAVVPDDDFILQAPSLLDRAARVTRGDKRDLAHRLFLAEKHQEPFYLSTEKDARPSTAAKSFLQQITGYVPEDYFRSGINRRGEFDGPALAAPWTYPVFAEGGQVAGVEHPNDDTGALTKIADFLRMGPRTPFRIPVVDDIADMLPRFAEGVASEYYGVNQNGDVNLGGYTKGAPLRDRFRPNVATEVVSMPALWGDEGGMEALNDVDRTDGAVRKAFGHSAPKTWSLDNAAYLSGKAAATGVLGSLRTLLGRTGMALPKLPVAMGADLKTLHHITDFFNPAAGRLRDAPIAGAVGVGLGAGIEQTQERLLQNSEEAFDALRERVLNDPAFQNALARGDKDTARMIAQRIMENADAG